MAGNENKNEDFPIEGVKLSWIKQVFIPTVCGGRDKLESLTTWEVLERFTKGNTTNTSYCQKLKDECSTEHVGMPNVFVSHWFGYKFLDVVDALSHHLKDEAETAILWWDLFSINQHIANLGWTFEWLSITFKSAIKKIGRVVMVMSPWNDPKPYTRTWCVYEAYCAISVGARFEIALGEKEEKQFMDDVISFTFRKRSRRRFQSFTNLLVVDAEESECTNDTDKMDIFNVIRNEIGFEELDDKVLALYGSWVASLAIRIAEDCSLSSTRSSVFLDIAEDILDDVSTDKAGRVYLNSSQAQTHRLGEHHPDTLRSMKKLARVYELQNKYDEAERLHLKCLEAQSHELGEQHHDTLETMKTLADFYESQQRYDKAERLYLERLEAQTQKLGQHHSDALESMKNLARYFKSHNKNDEAERLYLNCLEAPMQIFRENQQDTLESCGNLARFYKSQGKHDKAERLSERLFFETSRGSNANSWRKSPRHI